MRHEVLKIDAKNNVVKVLGGMQVKAPVQAIRIKIDGVDITDMFDIESELEIYYETEIKQVPVTEGE